MRNWLHPYDSAVDYYTPSRLAAGSSPTSHYWKVTLKPGEAPDWKALDEPKFTRLVEALITEEYAAVPGARVEPVDGRGGDGGVDILVREPGRVTVFQLKFYPEGFDGRYTDRRRHIKGSLEAACASQPDMTAWVLVYPATPTRSGTVFLTNLAKQHAPIDVTAWGRNRLDTLCGRHMRVVTALSRTEPYFVTEMKQLNAEAAVLESADDLSNRLGRLWSLADSRDPHWGVKLAIDNETVTQSLYAKHPQAAERSPITIHTSFEFGPDDAALRSQIDRVLGYGAGQVDIPQRVIRDVSVSGPEWMNSPDTASRISFVAPAATEAEAPDLTVTFRSSGQVLGAHTGRTISRGVGYQGMTLTVQIHQHLTLRLLIPESSSKGDELRLDAHLDVTGGDVHAVRRAIDCRLQLDQADGLDLDVVGHGPLGAAHAEVSDPRTRDRDELYELRELADDLAHIQETLNRHFPFPSEYTNIDRIRVRQLRRMLEGYSVPDILPAQLRWVPISKPAPVGQQHELAVQFYSGEPSIVALQFSDPTWPVCGHDLNIPDITAWHPALRAIPDPGSDRMTVQAVDDTPLRWFMPDRVTGDTAPVTAWELTGIDEPTMPR